MVTRLLGALNLPHQPTRDSYADRSLQGSIEHSLARHNEIMRKLTKALRRPRHARGVHAQWFSWRVAKIDKPRHYEIRGGWIDVLWAPWEGDPSYRGFRHYEALGTIRAEPDGTWRARPQANRNAADGEPATAAGKVFHSPQEAYSYITRAHGMGG